VARFEAATQRWLPLGAKQVGVAKQATASSGASSGAPGGGGSSSPRPGPPAVAALAWDATRNLLFVGGR
jgi:hypothetical protein